MVSVPKDEEIRARAVALGLVSESARGALPNAIRRRVAALIFDEKQAGAEAPQAVAPVLLSRFTYETDAGRIQVDVTLHPHQK